MNISRKLNSILNVLLILIFTASCATTDEKAAELGKRKGELKASTFLPDYPDDCRRGERTGIVVGDPLKVAAKKADNAISRANIRIYRCADWYDRLKREYEIKDV